MKPLSNSASKVRASTTLAVDSLAKQMKADGLDVVGFGTGEPDFDTPDNIKEAGIAAIRSGQTKYTPANGIVPLREAAAEMLLRDCGVSYTSAEITIASGAKHNLFVALMALLNPGDEVILPAPYWVSYYEMIGMAGGVPVEVVAGEAQSFKVTPAQIEAAVTPKTKVLVLNNPSNPTGMVYSEAELRAIANVCVKHDLYIISDEVYYCLLYDGLKFTSVASLGDEIKERTVLINAVSKAYSMTGWRIGFAAANKEISTVMANFLSHSTGAPGTMNQWAAVEALRGQQETVTGMRRVFEERRNYMVKRLNEIEGVSCIMPQGAFYVMMNIEKLLGKTIGGAVINNDDDFAVEFLKTGLVAVVPCSGFGAPNFIRWTYAASLEDIKEGLDRLEKFLKTAK